MLRCVVDSESPPNLGTHLQSEGVGERLLGVYVRIPAKPINDSYGKPISDPMHPINHSERSDAGKEMMPEVIGFVKKNSHSEPQATLGGCC